MASPFGDFRDLHGSTPRAILEAADLPSAHAHQLAQLGKDLLTDARRSDAATIGDLKQIRQVPTDAAEHATRLSCAGELAAACLRRFGTSAHSFDEQVEALNTDVAAAPYLAILDPLNWGREDELEPGRIRSEKKAALQGTYEKYVAQLDASAASTALLLKSDPNDRNVIRTLFREGFIPLDAIADWPSLGLTSGDYAAYYKAVLAGLAPDVQARIKKALADVKAASGTSDAGLDPALIAAFGGLSPAEAGIVVGLMSDDDLDRLNTALGQSAWPLGGLSTEQRISLSNLLLPTLPLFEAQRLSQHVTEIQPAMSGTEGSGNEDQKDLHWKWVDGELVPYGSTDPSQIEQGDLGDCWFLAGLGAQVHADPSFVQDHVHDNGNGTYTVTFYRDGEPTEVTVDSALPTNSWDQTAFTHDPGGGKWVQIYEKAYAQYNGGYSSIEGGYGDHALKDLTGEHAAKHDDDDYSAADLQGLLASGHAITAGSESHHSGFLWHHEDETFPDHHDLVTSHEYVVVSAGDGKVTLRNPWGSNQEGIPDEVTLSEDDFHQHFGEVSVGDD